MTVNGFDIGERGSPEMTRPRHGATAAITAEGDKQLSAETGLYPDSDRTNSRQQPGTTDRPDRGLRSPNPDTTTVERRKLSRTADSTGGCGPESELHNPPPRYADIAGILAGTVPEPPVPTILTREDGRSLFYTAQVNFLFGDPESGKTWVALAACAESLMKGGRVLLLDLDHNGVVATVSRLLMMGVRKEVLSNLDAFRYCSPEDVAVVTEVVTDCQVWRPDIAVVDSIGELLPMLGADSNSADDFTRAHTRVLKPLMRSGAAVIAIDHLAKNTGSRAHGPGGTAAKRRSIGGVSLRVKAQRQFTPRKGGTALLLVNKDRHGGLREHCPMGDAEAVAGTFVLRGEGDDGPTWSVLAPQTGQRDPEQSADRGDLALIDAMEPKPTSAEQVRKNLRCNKARANLAWTEWKGTRRP